MMVRTGPAAFLAALLFLTTVRPLGAQLPAGPGDWPGWRGPDRTDLSTETGLLKQWPAEGPKLLWKATGLGAGFSTPSVAGSKIYLVGTKGKDEYLFALDATDGRQLWATRVGTMTGGHPGPRSTPTVDGDRLYVISSDGKLVCADRDGKAQWTKDLKADFGGQCGSWAYAESPLVDGDVVVCTPGGDQATLVTLDKKTGAVRWKAALTGLPAGKKRGYTTAAYSSVIAADAPGGKEYIQFLSGGVVGVSAKDGRLLWHYDHPANGTANCSTPVYRDGLVFAASGYNTGGGLTRIVRKGDQFTAEEVYFVKELQNHHGGVDLVGDHLYGTGSAALLCVDFKTGKIAWQERSVGKGSVAYADGCLYVRSENGPVALVEATPAGYREKGRFNQPDRSKEKAWPHPVIAGGHLLLRDQDVLLCYDVKAP